MVPRSIAEGDFFAAGAVNDLTSGNLFFKSMFRSYYGNAISGLISNSLLCGESIAVVTSNELQ